MCCCNDFPVSNEIKRMNSSTSHYFWKWVFAWPVAFFSTGASSRKCQYISSMALKIRWYLSEFKMAQVDDWSYLTIPTYFPTSSLITITCWSQYCLSRRRVVVMLDSHLLKHCRIDGWLIQYSGGLTMTSASVLSGANRQQCWVLCCIA